MTTLYVHIPFCEKKCFYCSFVVSIAQRKRIDQYIKCIKTEAEQFKNLKVDALYIGGGTPTFLDNKQLEDLDKVINESFHIKSGLEKTIEMNPEGVDESKAKTLFNLGFNRISLGVQSLNDKYLKYLGRIHNAQRAIDTYNQLRRVGFTNINVDLMYGFPEQENKEILSDLTQIIALDSQHVSLYTLTIDPNSRFHAKNVILPSGDIQAQQYQLVTEALESELFKQYEVSNFSKQGFESKHNTNYWVGGNYIGLGVGAHSHLDGRRFWNGSKLIEYINDVESGKSPLEGDEILNKNQRLIEELIFGLRMNEGVVLNLLESKYGCKLTAETKELLDKFIATQHLIIEKDKLKVTPQGRLVLDDICAVLI